MLYRVIIVKNVFVDKHICFASFSISMYFCVFRIACLVVLCLCICDRLWENRALRRGSNDSAFYRTPHTIGFYRAHCVETSTRSYSLNNTAGGKKVSELVFLVLRG